MPTNKPIITVENLNVTYFMGRPNEVRALTDINLKLYEGEFIIFFGPSGCGKSTLLYSISGMERRATGKVIIGGQNIIALTSKQIEKVYQKTIGMIFQAYYLIGSLSILDNVCLPQVAVSGKKKERVKTAKELLTRFGVIKQANKLPNELSGGQQQRVAICRSVMNDPKIILADEPVGNLDSKSTDEVMALLKDLNEKQKKTIILVTHNPAHLSIAHRVVYIKDGKLVRVKVNEAINEEVKKEEKEINEKAKAEGKEKKKESISRDLEVLATTFSSVKRSASMLVPFKAKEIVAEALTQMTSEEISSIEDKVQKLILDEEYTQESIYKFFDDEISNGGLGFDRRTAERLANKIGSIVGEIKVLQEKEEAQDNKRKSGLKQEVMEIRYYLVNAFNMKLKNLDSLKMMDRLIELRLKNKINETVVRDRLDMSLQKGGAGLDRRMAKQFARRLELLMLGKYKK